LAQGQSFVSETVFSHPSKLALIAQAQQQGFFVLLLVVALDAAQTLVARVAQRVAEGGHAVANERIASRYPRTMAHLAQAVRLADAAVLYDSAQTSPGTSTAVALCKGAWTQVLVQPVPAWASQMLALNPVPSPAPNAYPTEA
jgi:predicted ABC-type ATPase